MLALLKSKTVLAGLLLAIGEVITLAGAPDIGGAMQAFGFALLGIGVKHAIEKNTELTADARNAAVVASENAAHAENAANAAVTDVQATNRTIRGAISDTIRDVLPSIVRAVLPGK